MATIVQRGTKLAYDDRGAGEPAFVFLHGWTSDRWFFAPQAEHFRQRQRVVSVDLRGHGESDRPEGAYPIEAGNQEPREQFIRAMLLPTSDRKLVEDVVAVMMAAPSHVAVSALRRILDFDSAAVAAQCTVPALHLAAPGG